MEEKHTHACTHMHACAHYSPWPSQPGYWQEDTADCFCLWPERIKASSAVPVSMVVVTWKEKGGIASSVHFILQIAANPCCTLNCKLASPAAQQPPDMRVGLLEKQCPLESHPGLIWKGDGTNISRRHCDKGCKIWSSMVMKSLVKHDRRSKASSGESAL